MSLTVFLCMFMSAARGLMPSGNDYYCSSNSSRDVDCSVTHACMLRTNDFLQPLPPPSDNHYQCYDTCISEESVASSPQCIATVSIPNVQSTLDVSGPFHLRQYSIHRLLSPHSNDTQHYPNNQHCQYSLVCEEPNAFMSLVLEDLDIEPAPETEECHNNTACLDYIQLRFPTGSLCTLCGSDPICRETGRPLDPLLLFNGRRPGLSVIFHSNRVGRGCGFRLLATCVQRDYFESLNCVLPPPQTPPTYPPPFPLGFGKRAAPYRRTARYFHGSGITVPGYASVVYDEGGVVRMMVEKTEVYSIPGVRVMQVYNSIEGSLTFYGTSNGRSFPGHGVLKIGIGIILYTQESVPSQFKPTKSEQMLIQLLHHGLLHTLDNNGSTQCHSELTIKQRSEMEEAALEYGQACSGFLRAVACAYQQLHMTRVRADCLVNVTFPSPTDQP